MPNTEQSIEETGGVPEIELEVEVFGMTQTAVDKTLTIPDMAAEAKATGDAIQNALDDIGDVAADVADIMDWTGEDLPLNSETTQTVAEAIASIFSDLYQVGSVFITSAEQLPEVISSIGTWTEIAMPLRLLDIKNGSRTYVEPNQSFEPGNMHMWMRTE